MREGISPPAAIQPAEKAARAMEKMYSCASSYSRQSRKLEKAISNSSLYINITSKAIIGDKVVEVNI